MTAEREMGLRYKHQARRGCPGDSVGKNPRAVQEPQETRVRSLSWEDLLEEETAAHSSVLAWGTPGTEEPGGLQSMGSQGVGHDRATKQQPGKKE